MYIKIFYTRLHRFQLSIDIKQKLYGLIILYLIRNFSHILQHFFILLHLLLNPLNLQIINPLFILKIPISQLIPLKSLIISKTPNNPLINVHNTPIFQPDNLPKYNLFLQLSCLPITLHKHFLIQKIPYKLV